MFLNTIHQKTITILNSKFGDVYYINMRESAMFVQFIAIFALIIKKGLYETK